MGWREVEAMQTSTLPPPLLLSDDALEQGCQEVKRQTFWCVVVVVVVGKTLLMFSGVIPISSVILYCICERNVVWQHCLWRGGRRGGGDG